MFDADIAQCFDSLSHTFLLSRLHSFKATIKSWLKAGVVDFGQTLTIANAKGAPQGAPLSPLLLNIVLDGMERLFGSENAQGQHVTPSCRKGKNKGISLCRYAADLAVTAPSKEILEHYVRPKLEAFLKIRGLELSQAKTRIVHVEEGFHFLGFTIRRFKNKVLTLPQKDKVKAHVRAIRSYLRQHRQAPSAKVIKDLNPVIRGWSNYYRHCAAKATFNKVDHLIWQKLWRWAKRRHPNKSARWVKARYFDEHWRFREGRYTIKRHQTTPIIRHVKVKAKASPMNPELKDYWSQRRIKQLAQKTYWYQHAELLRRQQGNCGLCGVTLNREDPIDDHHILPRQQGGSNQLNNRMLVHIWCHHAYHQRHGYSFEAWAACVVRRTSGSEGARE
jgi:RNA-directed DNA polymerase